MLKELTPTEGRLIVDISEQKSDMTSSGIVLPPNREKERPTMGLIVKSHPNDDVPAGAKVIFDKYGSTELEHEDKEYLVVNIEDVLAIVT